MAIDANSCKENPVMILRPKKTVAEIEEETHQTQVDEYNGENETSYEDIIFDKNGNVEKVVVSIYENTTETINVVDEELYYEEITNSQ